jgi:hypothetical protein
MKLASHSEVNLTSGHGHNIYAHTFLRRRPETIERRGILFAY